MAAAGCARQRSRVVTIVLGWACLASALATLGCSGRLSPVAPVDVAPPREVGAPTSGSPSLAQDTVLRAAPLETAREVARVPAQTPVRVAGRLEDSSWYVVEVVGRLDALGWVRAADLAGADASKVLVVAPPGGAGAVAGPAGPRDLPNLVLETVSVRQNQLMVALSNDGYTDLDGPFAVTVGAGAPHVVTLPGKPLRPGDRIEVPIEGEYVQRRAVVSIGVTVQVPEETTEDNHVDVTVEPDQPLDLEILSVVAAPRFIVTLRNNASIPLVGTVTISVRESRPSERLLTRLDDAPLNIARKGTQDFPITAVVGADLTRIQVLIHTPSINDVELANDVYPR